MKKKEKIYIGIILSFIMIFLVSTSSIAAEEGKYSSNEDYVEGTENSEIDENKDQDESVWVGDDGEQQDPEDDPESVDDPNSDDNPDNNPNPIPVEEIELDKVSLTLKYKGQIAQLNVTITPTDATDPEVTWSSSDTSVATVQNGMVTAVGKNGTTRITVTVTSADDTEFTKTCNVTVSLYGDGFHQDPDSDDWYYFKNGAVDTSKTEVIKGTVNGISGWWNVVKGKVTKGETVAKNSNGWWYINSNGMVDFSYNGFAKNTNGWWYLENGKVNFDKNSVIKDTRGKIDGTVSWWYVVGSKVQTSFTGLADYSNENGWWYINNGKVTFDVNTVAKNKNGWWYVKGSKVDFSYNGFEKNSNGWWYLENGKVTFNKNSVIKDTRSKVDGTISWWYVVGSKVQSNFTGLADYKNENGWWYINNGKVTFNENTVAKNKNGWWYVKGSKVDFSYNGFEKNSNGWWYLENGKVTFNKNSVIKDTRSKVDGTISWWYVVGSKVQSNFTGLADYKNENGWWYINNGKVTFNVNTVAKNKNGWYYVKNSKVDFSYSGSAQNENGWWYISEGKVDFSIGTVIKVGSDWLYYYGAQDSSFTGLARNENGTWYVKDGKVDFNFTGTVTVDGINYSVTNGRVGIAVSTTMNSKAQAQRSSTKWLIVVDTSACRLGVFTGSKGNWAAQYYWLCSPGKPSTPTKKGTFTTQSKGKSFGSSTYTCWYYTQFYGNYLMHSVLYKPGSMTQLSDGRLGQQLSHGCVRLALENAKWIYDNIPRGTTVYVY